MVIRPTTNPGRPEEDLSSSAIPVPAPLRLTVPPKMDTEWAAEIALNLIEMAEVPPCPKLDWTKLRSTVAESPEKSPSSPFM